MLNTINCNELIILGCNCGHNDFNNSLTPNIARCFAYRIAAGAKVIASDGTVQSQLSLFTYKKFKSIADNSFYYYCADPNRDNLGWLYYYRQNSYIQSGLINKKTVSIPELVEGYLN